MKRNFILDVIIYLILPLIFLNTESIRSINYADIVALTLIVFYSIFIKKNYNRVNLTGILTSILCINLVLIRNNADNNFDIYVYETYAMFVVCISIVVLKFLDNNLILRAYKDICTSLGYNKAYIFKQLKDKRILQKFDKMILFINIHLISLIFIRNYAISTYGMEEYLNVSDLNTLINIISIIYEIYMVFEIIKIQNLNTKDKVRYIKQINKQYKDNVIYLNKYKKANK